MWSHDFVWVCLWVCENPKDPAHSFANIVLLFILNSLIYEWKMRNIDVMFSCDYSSSQQKLKLVNTCIFLWHVWHFRKKIRQCYSHSSNVPELFSSERSWQKKKQEMHTFIFFSVTKMSWISTEAYLLQ